jgi:hypothetical protein
MKIVARRPSRPRQTQGVDTVPVKGWQRSFDETTAMNFFTASTRLTDPNGFVSTN